MNEVPNVCPECKTILKATHECGYQEYPGATPQAPYTYVECPKCGWDEVITGKFDMDNAVGFDGGKA